MEIVPVAFDFNMFKRDNNLRLDSTTRYSDALELPTQFGSFRYRPLTSSDGRQSLINGLLRPLLDVSAEFPDVVCGWDLFNEPDWCVPVSFGGEGNDDTAVVPLQDMLDFLQVGVDWLNTWANEADIRLRQEFPTHPRLNCPHFSSIGFARHTTLTGWGRVNRDSSSPLSPQGTNRPRRPQNFGVKYNQFHVYGDRQEDLRRSYLTRSERRLPRASCRNIFLGEIGTDPRTRHNLLTADYDSTARVSLDLRLIHCSEQRYPEVFLWVYTGLPLNDSRFWEVTEDRDQSRLAWTDMAEGWVDDEVQTAIRELQRFEAIAPQRPLDRCAALRTQP
jgi:hypothetical protein